MMWNVESTFFWCFILIQFVGMAGLAVARLGDKMHSPARCQLAFFGCLLLVGVMTVICLQSGNSYWLTGGITLAVMAVGATLDCGGAPCESVY